MRLVYGNKPHSRPTAHDRGAAPVRSSGARCRQDRSSSSRRQSAAEQYVAHVHLSKGSATAVQKERPLLPSARRYGDVKWKSRCGEWKAAAPCIDVLLMPALEDDELPQPQRMVAPARQMIVDQLLDERRLEIPAGETGWREQRVGEQLPQIASEPDAERHAESLLAPIEQVARHEPRR